MPIYFISVSLRSSICSTLLSAVMERKRGSERQKGSKVDSSARLSRSGSCGPDTADDSFGRSNSLQVHFKCLNNPTSLTACRIISHFPSKRFIKYFVSMIYILQTRTLLSVPPPPLFFLLSEDRSCSLEARRHKTREQLNEHVRRRACTGKAVWSDSSLNGLFAQTALLWPGDSSVNVITVGTVVSVFFCQKTVTERRVYLSRSEQGHLTNSPPASSCTWAASHAKRPPGPVQLPPGVWGAPLQQDMCYWREERER